MKVGITLFSSHPVYPLAMESLTHVARSMISALGKEHELVYLPPRYTWGLAAEVQTLAEEFLDGCDVIVGTATGHVPAVRQRIGSNVPIVSFMLGAFSRGGFGVDNQLAFLNTNDVMLLNCASDVELAQKFICNAQLRLLPFAYDEDRFFPLSEEERLAVRHKLGFGADDRILLYAGRVTLQKNLHTLLRVFAAVVDAVPTARLVISGPMLDDGSAEFGITPQDLEKTVDRLIGSLNVPAGRVVLIKPGYPGPLRELYNIADVAVNLTLHHDENFGLSQVEAMACGTPVVGTAWGGLKDTIVEGVSGQKVSTSLTPMGVKSNWWEAVNRMVALLRDDAARARYRESCVRFARERYSQAKYEQTLLDIVSRAAAAGHQPAERLQPTPFAQEFWPACHPSRKDAPPHLRGPRSYELYLELIRHVTETTADDVAPGEPLQGRQVLTLATPVTTDGDGRLRSDDPMYPFEIHVPPAHRQAFDAILSVAREQPAITAERLLERVAGGAADAAQTVEWMLQQGLLLRTRHVDGWLPPQTIDHRFSEPFFRIERFDRPAADFRMG